MLSREERRAIRKRKVRNQRITVVVVLLCVLASFILIHTKDKTEQLIEANIYPSSTPTLSAEATLSPDLTTEPTEEVEVRYGFTDDDVYLLAQLLCGSKNTDGDGEYDIDFAKEVNYYEISKVLGVVMNRVRSEEFPDTVYDVVTAETQFSVMPANLYKEPSDIALQTVQDWCDAYDRYDLGVQCIPEDHLYFSGDGITNTTRANY